MTDKLKVMGPYVYGPAPRFTAAGEAQPAAVQAAPAERCSACGGNEITVYVDPCNGDRSAVCRCGARGAPRSTYGEAVAALARKDDAVKTPPAEPGPCPCGCDEIVVYPPEPHDQWWEIFCAESQCAWEVTGMTRDMAIAAWNKRAPRAEPDPSASLLVATLTAERDAARDLAVRLEQEVARLKAEVSRLIGIAYMWEVVPTLPAIRLAPDTPPPNTAALGAPMPWLE